MAARPNPFHHLSIVLILMTAAALLAASTSAGSVGPGSRHGAAGTHRPPSAAPAYPVRRDARGRIIRSESAKERFTRQTG